MKNLERKSKLASGRSTSALAAVLVLTACLGSAPAERLFRLNDPEPAITTNAAAVAGTLAVEQVQARGALTRERSIIYRDQLRPSETQFYPTQLWEEAPATMVQAALAHCLGRARVFEAVVGHERNIRPKYALNATLDRLEHRVSGACSDAFIRLEVSLTDSDERKIVLSGVYQATAPTADSTVEALLSAFDRAMTEVCTEMVGDMNRWAGTRSRSVFAHPEATLPPTCGR